MARLSGTGVWSADLRYGDAAQAVEAAHELEELGYSALWLPDVGGDLFDVVERLLASTTNVSVATGVLNIWMHSADESAAAYSRLAAASGDRLVLGLGVSHASFINGRDPGRYQRPLSAMSGFLDGLDAAVPPVPVSHRLLAALGPKMLDLARSRAAGAHPYNVTPEHTASARQALGPDLLLAPEHAVALTTDAEEARALGRAHLAHYLALPNYTNNLRRFGFGDEDFADGGSRRLIDALVAWGDEGAIAARLNEHRAAGADHVCVQVLSSEGLFPFKAWRELAPALTAT